VRHSQAGRLCSLSQRVTAEIFNAFALGEDVGKVTDNFGNHGNAPGLLAQEYQQELIARMTPLCP